MSDASRREAERRPHALAEVGEIAASRRRLRDRLLGRERTVTLATAGAFVAAAAACVVLVPSERAPSLLTVAFLVGAYALVSKIELEVGPGSVVPTELVLVPMLFVLPPGRVPLCVAAGLVLAGAVDRLRGSMHGDRVAVLLCSSWHSVGPALVVGLAAPGAPSWSLAPVYAAAFAAQLGCDTAAVVVRHRLGRGVALGRLARPLGWVAVVDATLAPVGLVAAFAVAAEPLALLCLLPFAGLLQLFERDRRSRIDVTMALGAAVEDASRAARLDPLTGLGNRLAWEEAFDRAVAAGGPATVVLVDVDELKAVNDTYGHDAGDRLIQALAGALVRALPDSEPARIGGDEFAVLRLGDEPAGEVLARLDAELEGLRTLGGVEVAASIGVASCPPCRTLAEAMRVADERLYGDKRGVRRRGRAAG